MSRAIRRLGTCLAVSWFLLKAIFWLSVLGYFVWAALDVFSGGSRH
jgi:hypothetical protein